MGGKYHPHSGLQSGFTTVAIYWKAPAVALRRFRHAKRREKLREARDERS